MTKGLKFDTLVGTGLSGALVLPTLARSMRKNFAVVRKPDQSHSEHRVEGTLGKRWLFVDDLIDTGSTLRRVVEEIKSLKSKYCYESEFVGVLTYWEAGFNPADSSNVEYWLRGIKP